MKNSTFFITSIFIILFSGYSLLAQKNTISSEKYKITYISIDGEGYSPKYKYITVRQAGDIYTIDYGGYSIFSLSLYKKEKDNYYYQSEEGLLNVLSKVSLSNISKGMVTKGSMTITFECCLIETIYFEKINKSKK